MLGLANSSLPAWSVQPTRQIHTFICFSIQMSFSMVIFNNVNLNEYSYYSPSFYCPIILLLSPFKFLRTNLCWSSPQNSISHFMKFHWTRDKRPEDLSRRHTIRTQWDWWSETDTQRRMLMSEKGPSKHSNTIMEEWHGGFHSWKKVTMLEIKGMASSSNISMQLVRA